MLYINICIYLHIVSDIYIYIYIMEKGIATHSSILAWRIPWTEDPGELESMGHKDLDTTE